MINFKLVHEYMIVIVVFHVLFCFLFLNQGSPTLYLLELLR